MLGTIIFIVGIIALLVALGAIVSNRRPKALGTATIAGLIGIIAIFVPIFSIVPARTVGVAVEFGQPKRILENGPHHTTPWTNVEKFDLAMQNDIYAGDPNGDTGSRGAITVRLANGSQARADASIQWQLKPDGMMEMYNDYREMEAIRSNLVDRNFRDALNTVMGSYDPLNIDPESEDTTRDELSKEVMEIMSEKIGDQIDVRSVTIPIINYDDATQARIDELQTEFARTRIAEQKQNTAEKEADANRRIQESLSTEVLTNKCLDIVAESGQSPLGCFPGSGVSPVLDVKSN